jgi:hypothetical protein
MGDPATPRQNAWRGDTVLQAVAERLSRSATLALILSPVGLLIISATRLLIISDYNPVTASGIASSGGYVDTLLGTVIPLVPIFMPYLALILLFFNRVILGALAVAATALVSPMALSRSAAAHLAENDWHQITHAFLPITIIMIIFAICTLVLILIELVGMGFNVFFKSIATIACLVLIPAVAQLYPLPVSNSFYTVLVREPWLPAETITLSSGQKFVGYTLSDDGTWITVLKDDTRTINYYLASEIIGRQICRIGQNPPMQPLITIIPEGASASSRTQTCQTAVAERLSHPILPASPAISAKDHRTNGIQ